MSKMSNFSKKKMSWLLGIFLIAGPAFASSANMQVKGGPQGSDGSKWIPLFTAAGIERAGAASIALQASRYRAVVINPLLSEQGGVAVGDRLFISPFADGAALGTIDRVETDVNGVLAVRARIDGSEGYLLLSSDKGRSLGRLVLPDRREFEISYIESGQTHIIREFAPGARIALEGGSPLIPPSLPFSGPILTPLDVESPAAANTRIDVMIPYTPAARDYANASSGINNFISLAMQLAQLGMDNSLTNITVRLAYSALVDYTESGSSYTDLSRLQNPADGYLDLVHTWRDAYGADLIHLFTKVEDVGGLGYVLNNPAGRPDWAFSIGRIQQISWTLSSVHEWGHNMGCGHRKGQPNETWNGLFSYSAGWRWVGTDGNKYCSIMSYQDDFGGVTPTRVTYFSNPSLLYKGTPTGNAVDGDNARSLREIKTVISNYRAELGRNTLTITATAGGTTNPVPGIYTFTTDSVIQVIAQPNGNYRFLSWSGDATGSQTWVNITLDRDKSIAAAFQRIIYAPTNAAGQKVLNRSLSKSEYINIITFSADPNNVNITGYKIYQVDGVQRTEVAALDANTFTYWHRKVDGTKEYNYQVVAVNNEPREGDPAVIVIR